jgi:hypothetical protein
MRSLALLLALTFASPALAQVAPVPGFPASPITPQDNGLMALQEMQRQQLVQQQNQLMSLEAQMRAQQSIQDVRAMSVAPRLTPPDTTPGHALPNIDTSQLASIPDSALADSNRKVLDATTNRR